MDFENLLVEIEDHLATVIINRPKKLNALNKSLAKIIAAKTNRFFNQCFKFVI